MYNLFITFLNKYLFDSIQRESEKKHTQTFKYIMSKEESLARTTQKVIEKFQEQRLPIKKFNKESVKNFKKLKKSIQKAEIYREYELLSSLITGLMIFTSSFPINPLSPL